jgi:hypothetical protein
VKLLKKMESGRPGESLPHVATEPAFSKTYSPRTYAATNDGNGLPRVSSDGLPRTASSSVQRAASADVLAKRQQIANMIREAELEEESDTLIGKSIDMVPSLIIINIILLRCRFTE